jgi:hypothetical protein
MEKPMNRIATASMLSVLVFASGCALDTDGETGDETGDDVETSSVEQAFSSLWYYSWGDTKLSSADLGSATGRACFMSGVAGYLTVNNWPEGEGQAGAGVYIDANNHYRIFVDPAFTATLQTWVRCAGSTSLTTEKTWRSGDAPTILAPVTTNRRCFITKLTTGRDNEFSHGAFQSTLDNVWVTNDGTNWYINGNVDGLVWVRARCMDVNEDLGQFWGYSSPGNTNVWPLVQATNGATCFLTQVTGKLNAANDWVQGPYVSHNAAYNFYDFNTKNGTGGRVRCVR